MEIGILGTGTVGRTLGGRLAALGHTVTLGTRDVASTLARTGPDGFGNPPFSEWASAHPSIGLATFREAAKHAEMVINAASGAACLAILEQAGSDNLAGKVLLDVSNPLDFSAGFPPTLLVKDTDSLAEQIQAAFPQTKVVKALNTMNASVMVNPRELADGAHSSFVSGNDAQAKKLVTDVLESFGHKDVIDLGDISTARGPEMLLPLWLRLLTVLGTPTFNFKVVR